ncbi:endosialidase-like protein [Azospirillum brasilense]|uniref:Endosialidase-like protein n=1 Tax=Azospirillum brasilense TaxID=192 RepID=A0A560BNI4_AZOBR|nr:tail fiber domain-containing protein [Azospirillum brasilense]TWA74178.1 endosialidase-like protein [Azospirillum brasilense]
MAHIQIDDNEPRRSYDVGAPQTAFVIPFPFFSAADIRCSVGGLELASDGFSVTGAGQSAGGSLTLATSAANTVVTIWRDVAIKRTSDFPDSGPLRPSVLNTDLDRLTAINQQLNDKLNRSLRLPDGDKTVEVTLPPAPLRAGRLFGFDGDGALVAIPGPPEVAVTGTVPVAAERGVVARTLAQHLGTRLTIYDAGCLADGANDDAPALALFFATTVRKGGTLTIPWDAKLYLGSSVTVPRNWTLEGLGGNQGVTNNATESYYDRGAQVKLGPGATLRHGGNGGLLDLLVIRAGLVQPVPDVATAALLVSQFAGTGIESAGEDVTVRGCLILGHAVGVDSKGWARTKVLDCGVDCHFGINISGGWDINRLERCHVWPYMTATTPGVHAGSESSHAPLRRNAAGIDFNSDSGGNCDWSTAIDCFVYGHPIAFSQRNVSNVSFVRCQADYGSPNTGSLRGYSITGTTTYAALINCTGIAQATCVYVETTGGASADNGVRIIGGIWAASSFNIFIANGAAIVQGNQFYSGPVGVLFGSGAEPGSIIGNYFQGVADPIVIDGLVANKTEILGNSYDGVAEAEPNRLNTPLRVARAIDLEAASAPANQKFARWHNSNDEVTLQLVTDDYSTADPVYRVIKNGAFASTHQFYIGVTNQLEIGATNIRPNAHILPYGTGIFNLGGPSNLWLQLFAYSPTINTSDEAQKQDRAPIDDALLDAWADVSWCLYRMRDAVAEKGDAARIHSGAIAQQVHAALEAKGIDGFRYGLLCRDEVFEEVFEDRETEAGPRKELVERRPLGLRWGLRYTECFVVEAAYQRRRADQLEGGFADLARRVAALESQPPSSVG